MIDRLAPTSAARTLSAGTPRTWVGDRSILDTPLPKLDLLDRTLARCMALWARPKVHAVYGAEHILAAKDPFILALNHGTRVEALLVPAVLIWLRSGERIHFLADWNFRLVPLVGLLYRRSGAITVMRKSARPRFLNALKPLIAPAMPANEQASALVRAGRSIAIFPEGTVNRDATHLMRGRTGAARLSLQTGTKIVPAGIRYSTRASGEPSPRNWGIELHIGEPLVPPASLGGSASIAAVAAWHSRMMCEIGRLSQKVPTYRKEEIGQCASLAD